MPWLTAVMALLTCAAFVLTLGIGVVVYQLGRLFVRLDSLAERADDWRGAAKALEEAVERDTKAVKAAVEMIEGLELKGFQDGALRLAQDQVAATKNLLEAV